MSKVPIIMGVYNGFKRMDRSIKSMMNQTFTNWKFVICDESSADGLYKKLLSYAREESRIVVIKNPQHAGLEKTLNNCLNVAKGENIAVCTKMTILIQIDLKKGCFPRKAS